MVPTDGDASPAPIHREVVERMRSRFAGSRMFASTAIVKEEKLHLRAELPGDYYLGEASACFEIRWYRNDDFNFHYQEERQDSTWMCRWNWHPNAHNSRDHFHPPPAASRTDAEDAQWSVNHRDVSQLVLDRIEGRIETLWERQ